MKYYYFTPIVLFGFFLLPSHRAEQNISTYHAKLLNTNGPAGGHTGAPGEDNCTKCHSGAVQDGNNGQNLLTFNDGSNEIALGVSKMMTLNFTSGDVKNGFQLVALDENDEMAGVFQITDAANTQLRTQGLLGRQYVTHTSAGTSLDQWSFEWEAPSEAAEITFYVATNRTANNGNNSGDVIYLSAHSFSVEDSDPIANIDEQLENQVSFGYLLNNHQLIIEAELLSFADIHINLFDLSGKTILSESLGKAIEGKFNHLINLPLNMENGIYVATLFVDNKPYTKKFIVQR